MNDLMDISNELYRVYEWIGGYKVTIPNPTGMKREAEELGFARTEIQKKHPILF